MTQPRPNDEPQHLHSMVYEHACASPCPYRGQRYVERLLAPEQGIRILVRPICAVTGTQLIEVERVYE